MEEAGRIKVVSPSGKLGSIDASQLDAATEIEGYRLPTQEDYAHAEKEKKYGSGLQQAATAAEGLASGVIPFGGATAIEKYVLGVPEEDIRGRREVNPNLHIGTQGLGFVGSLVGPGLLAKGILKGAAALEMAGSAGLAEKGLEAAIAAENLGKFSAAGVLGKAANTVSKLAPEGNAIIGHILRGGLKTATEAALFQSGDEISKLITNDPKTSVETALANVGMAGGLGAVMGAGFGGASGLWQAANETKVGQLINDFTSRGREYLNPEMAAPAREGLSEGAKYFDDLVKRGVFKNLTSKGIAAVIGAKTLNPYVGKVMGAIIGERFLDPLVSSVLPSIYGPILRNAPSAAAFKAAAAFGLEVAQGAFVVSKASQALFEKDKEVLSEKQMPNERDLKKLQEQVDLLSKNPSRLINSEEKLGHYMPEHATALGESLSRIVGYLNINKPRETKDSPFGAAFMPNKTEEGAYQRTLSIAQQPLIVMKKLKEGVISGNDIKDLSAMYPGLYKSMKYNVLEQVTKQMMAKQNIPYKTKLALSLFLGENLVSGLSPQNIASSQAHLNQMAALKEANEAMAKEPRPSKAGMRQMKSLEGSLTKAQSSSLRRGK